MVTEESIGDLIQQPWCTVEVATACLHKATYAITWRTYLQSSFTQGNQQFHQIMKGAVPIRSFSGAAGSATVWKTKGGVMRRQALLLAAVMMITGCAHSLIPARDPGTTRTAASLGQSKWPVLGTSRPVLGVDLYALNNYPAAQVRGLRTRTLGYIKNVLKADAVGIVWNFYTPNLYSAVVQASDATLSASECGHPHQDR